MSNFYDTQHNTGGFLFEVTKSKDDGDQNLMALHGMDGFKPTNVVHAQPFGFSGVPPVGGQMIGMPMGGQFDKLVAFGGEHAKHKPKNLGTGNVALYNADGTIMKMVGKSTEYTGDSFTFKCGGVTMKLSGSGLEITGGQVKHNGKNIGSDHTHINSGGAGNGGPPA